MLNKNTKYSKENKRLFYVTLTLICLIILLTSSVQAAWYEHVAVKRSDPYSIGYIGVEAKAMGTFRIGVSNPAQGKVYIIFTQQQYQQVLSSKATGYEYFSNTLNQKQADFWKRHFHNSSWGGVPWYIGLASSANLAASLGMLAIDQIIANGQPKVSSATMSEVIAVGGQFKEMISINENAGRPLLNIRVFYQVRVGSEYRSYLLYSSQYALKVVP